MFPVILSNSFIKIYSYPLFLGLASGMAFLISSELFHRQGENMRRFQVMFWGAFVSAWLGAKISFLLFSAKGEGLQYAAQSSFWFGGGFVFYGGLLVGVSFLMIITHFWKNQESLYLFLPGFVLAHAIGRVGCLLAGCCYGTVSHLSWSVNLYGAYRHPVQLYEAFALFLLWKILYFQIKKGISGSRVIIVYLASYSTIRFGLEFVRGDSIRGMHYFGLSTSQYISIAVFVTTLIFLVVNRLKKRSKV